MIKMFGVTKVFSGNIVALRDIDLHIRKGEFVFLVGPTGSGKTTLMRLIYKDIVPTKGQVYVDGENLQKLKNSHIPYFRRDIGVVFQDYKLIEDKTVFENVAFVLEVIGVPKRECESRVMEVLDRVKVAHRRYLYPHQLSGGEQQRVAIARAIVKQPSILLSDEPTGNLDPKTAWDIMEIFRDINIQGTTVLIATHNKTIVDAMKKRVVALKNGSIVSDLEEGLYGF